MSRAALLVALLAALLGPAAGGARGEAPGAARVELVQKLSAGVFDAQAAQGRKPAASIPGSFNGRVARRDRQRSPRGLWTPAPQRRHRSERIFLRDRSLRC